MKIIWLADSHFLLEIPALRELFKEFVQAIAAEKPDILLLGGDMCTRAGLSQLLSTFRRTVLAPMYCILGNHEFLGGLVTAVRDQMASYVSMTSGVTWLSQTKEPVWLTDGVALVGTETWGDARAGNLSSRNLRRRAHEFLYDQIEEIRVLTEACDSDTVCIARKVQAFLRGQGDEAAQHLDQVGRIAAENARQVVMLLHAPPFPEATLYRGHPDPIGLPFFCARAAGEVIRKLAEEYPHVQFTVLAGHTHCQAKVMVLPNLNILVHDPCGKGATSRWEVLEVDREGVGLQTNI